MDFSNYKMDENIGQEHGFQSEDRETFPTNGYTETEARAALDHLVEHGVVPKFNDFVDGITDAKIFVGNGDWNYIFRTEGTNPTYYMRNVQGKTIQIRHHFSGFSGRHYSNFIDISTAEEGWVSKFSMELLEVESSSGYSQFTKHTFLYELTPIENDMTKVEIHLISEDYDSQDMSEWGASCAKVSPDGLYYRIVE